MRVVADQGLEAVSLRQVAAEAGVTGGMVQHYFPNKDAMMDFAMAAASSRYEQRIGAAMAELGEAPSPVQSAETILGCLLPADEQGRRDARVALAFMSYSAVRKSASESLAADNTGMQGVIADLLRSAQASGMAPEDREVIATAAMIRPAPKSPSAVASPRIASSRSNRERSPRSWAAAATT